MSDASELALPIDWKLIEVEKFSQVKGGKRLPAGEEFADEMTPYPYLRVTNMVNGTIKDEGIVYVKPEIQKFISNYTVASQDLYVTIAGTLGLFGKIPEKYSGAQLTENAAKLTKIDLGNYDLDYLNYSLRGDFVQSQINKEIGIGAGVPKLALYRIEKLKVPLPCTLENQQKIAKILTTIDQLIEKTQSLIDKHTAIKQGMMADLFTRGIDPTTGQLRPPVEQAPHLYKETELGWIPKGWDLYPITDLSIDGLKNGYFKKPELVGSGYKLINVSELYQDYGIDIILDSVERVEANIKDYKKYMVEPGDLFFTRSSLVLSGIAKCNIARSLPEPTVYECHVMRLKPNKSLVDPDYLALYCQTRPARNYLMARAKQVTMTTIAQPDIQNMPIPKPSNEEQNMIIQKIITLSNKTRSEEKCMSKLIEKKDGLMQDLLTGKVIVD